MLGAAMLRGILNGFLQNPEQAQRCLFREMLRDSLTDKLNLDVLLLGKFFAEAPCRCRNAEEFQFGRVQSVRKTVYVVGDVEETIASLTDLFMYLTVKFADVLVDSLQLDGDQGNLLIDIVMKFPGDPNSLLLLGFYQSVPHFRKRLLSFLLIGHIGTRPYVARQRAIGMESRHPDVQHPAVFSVVSLQAVIQFEGLFSGERLVTGQQASLQVLLVDTVDPSLSELLRERSPPEIQPTLVEVVTGLIGPGHP